jgi:hypothetical protein
MVLLLQHTHTHSCHTVTHAGQGLAPPFLQHLQHQVHALDQGLRFEHCQDRCGHSPYLGISHLLDATPWCALLLCIVMGCCHIATSTTAGAAGTVAG